MEEEYISYDDGSNNGNGLSNVLGSIFGAGGIGSAASGAGDVICAIKGNCAPKSLTVVNQPAQRANNTLLLIGGIALAGLIIYLIVKK